MRLVGRVTSLILYMIDVGHDNLCWEDCISGM